MLPELPRIVLGVLLASVLSIRGHKKRSLSPGGAVAAFVVGSLSFASSTRFGLSLYAFYLSATRVTSYKSSLKEKLEDGFKESAGYRGVGQVLASALPGVIIALTYLFLFRYDTVCVDVFPMRTGLLLAFLLFFAACAGDTFASEIGIAMPGPGKEPVLIYAPWRNVPRGTNGGVTWEGTIASAVGGLILGLVYFLLGPQLSTSQAMLILVGVYGGLVGSAIDSLLGALLQASYYDTETGKVLKDAPEKKDDMRFTHICGSNLLSGEAVNTISSCLTCLTAPLLVPLFPAPNA